MGQHWSRYIYPTAAEAARRSRWPAISRDSDLESSFDLLSACALLDDEEAIPPRRSLLSSDFPSRAITTLSSREVYRNHWMRVREDQILRSNGQQGIYGVVDKDDSAIILPIDDDYIWLVEQYRYPIEERALELPQGGWEMADVDPEELARGELREELGLDAASMIYLGSLWIAYGFTRQRQHVFVATGLTQVPKEPDAEEHDLVVHRLPIAEFEEKMRSSEIRDNCTVSAWGLYLLWKRRLG